MHNVCKLTLYNSNNVGLNAKDKQMLTTSNSKEVRVGSSSGVWCQECWLDERDLTSPSKDGQGLGLLKAAFVKIVKSTMCKIMMGMWKHHLEW